MDVSIFVALISVSGVGVGALLSGVGYYFRVRAERIKTKNSVLFHLLEIRALVRSQFVDPDTISQVYFDYCNDYFHRNLIDGGTDIPEEAKSFIQSHIRNICNATRPAIDVNFIESLNRAVAALSLDDPVLAYRLRGKERVDEILNAQSAYIENVTKCGYPEGTPEGFLKRVSGYAVKLNREVVEDLLSDLEADIGMVAKGIGLVQYFTVQRLLKKSGRPKFEILSSEFDPVMTKALAHLFKPVESASTSSD